MHIHFVSDAHWRICGKFKIEEEGEFRFGFVDLCLYHFQHIYEHYNTTRACMILYNIFMYLQEILVSHRSLLAVHIFIIINII